ncbi:Di-copper centre-containing protein [Coniochaeta sp. PMI_546]|nr:Di-copper centre-containing protein [Coniochaeta sp. PMI_546]
MVVEDIPYHIVPCQEDVAMPSTLLLRTKRPALLQRFKTLILPTCLLAALISSLLLIFYFFQSTWQLNVIDDDNAISLECEHPAIRREWRRLTRDEQTIYIASVQCLMGLPSQVREGTSRYDDFVHAHSLVGVKSHYAAAFLPWHRLFVHSFERVLREECVYEGPFPYWDWTRDASGIGISDSPVFDDIYGFGGNGDEQSPEILHGGHCVATGPFANTTRAWSALSKGQSHNVTFWPHCLNRGIMDSTDPAAKDMYYAISPEYVAQTLDQADYDQFFRTFETGAHNAIPSLMRGDWITFTAPNDPLFYLHHSQIDRLWWMWQMEDTSSRLSQFHGPNEDFRHHKHEGGGQHPHSSLADNLSMGGIGIDRTVQEVMDTSNMLLCYAYE